MTPSTHREPLDNLPEGTSLRAVTAEPGSVDGHRGTRVRLAREVALHGEPGVDYIDQPTMALLPLEFETGRISVDLHSRLTDDAPDYARGFAGIAFHASPTFDTFEAIYLRPLNGTLTNPGEPRASRGIQYFAYPEWPFDRLRSERPDSGYEAAAPITPSTWIRLTLDITPDRLAAAVDGTPVLDVSTPLTSAATSTESSRIGLFVDIGTDAHFANLEVEFFNA